MKADLDRLMSARGLDAIVVEGADGLAQHSAAWQYLTRNQRMTGFVVKRRHEPARLLFHPMERQQADATGLALESFGRWDLRTIARDHPTRLDAAVALWRLIFRDLEIAGRVGWYGASEASHTLALLDALRASIPATEFVGEYENGILDVARRTKDRDEIALMEDVGRRTCDVVREVIAFLGEGSDDGDGTLVDPDGRPVTIGDVKALVRRACDRRDLEVGDPIFAQGADAAIPHAHGNASEALRLGAPIVFDLYPRCRTSGYYHDLTRTLSLGYAGAELQRVYDDVIGAFDAILGEYRVGERTKHYQDRCCERFESRGHQTVAKHWPLEEGYVHALGHGLGLEVHEPLAFSSFADRGDVLERGNVFALEPGLYYPSKGIGVRVEDTIVCDLDGTFRSITPLAKTLVIEISSS